MQDLFVMYLRAMIKVKRYWVEDHTDDLRYLYFELERNEYIDNLMKVDLYGFDRIVDDDLTYLIHVTNLDEPEDLEPCIELHKNGQFITFGPPMNKDVREQVYRLLDQQCKEGIFMLVNKLREIEADAASA